MPANPAHAPVTSPAFDIPDDVIAGLIMQAHGVIEGQNPQAFGAPVGAAVDWSKAKTLLKTMFPYVLAVLKTAYPGIPVDQIVDLLNLKIDGFQASSPGVI